MTGEPATGTDYAGAMAREHGSAPLRIVHAVRSDRFAGVERFILTLALAQRAAGHRVVVIGGAPERMEPELTAAGIPFLRGRTTAGVKAALLRAQDADVVNTHMTAADLAAAALRALPHRPAIVSTRHFAHPRGGLGPVRWDALVDRIADADLAISDAVADAIRVPSTVVHSGLPEGAAVPRNPQQTVLIAQRLQPEKRTEIGIRAFAASGLARDGWMLDIAGDGGERAPLERLVDGLSLSGSVRFLGQRSDIPELMSTAGVLLAPCPTEGLGLTVLEAMGAGLPVVAARGGGHIELLEDVTPSPLFDPRNTRAAGALLAEIARDPDGCAQIARQQQETRARSFTLDAQVNGTDALYRAAIRTASGHA